MEGESHQPSLVAIARHITSHRYVAPLENSPMAFFFTRFHHENGHQEDHRRKDREERECRASVHGPEQQHQREETTKQNRSRNSFDDIPDSRNSTRRERRKLPRRDVLTGG